MSGLQLRALTAVENYLAGKNLDATGKDWILPLVREAIHKAEPFNFEGAFRQTPAYARLIELRSDEYIFRKNGSRYECGATDDAYSMWLLAGGE